MRSLDDLRDVAVCAAQAAAAVAGGWATGGKALELESKGPGDMVAGAPAWHERMLDVIRNAAVPAGAVP